MISRQADRQHASLSGSDQGHNKANKCLSMTLPCLIKSIPSSVTSANHLPEAGRLADKQPVKQKAVMLASHPLWSAVSQLKYRQAKLTRKVRLSLAVKLHICAYNIYSVSAPIPTLFFTHGVKTTHSAIFSTLLGFFFCYWYQELLITVFWVQVSHSI